ncbi:MAG: DUF1127 domain-containing protein [Acidiferrobacterales bacterium]
MTTKPLPQSINYGYPPMNSVRRLIRVATARTVNTVRVMAEAIRRERRRNAYLRALRRLNDQTLQDIGLHRQEITWAVDEMFDAQRSSSPFGGPSVQAIMAAAFVHEVTNEIDLKSAA